MSKIDELKAVLDQREDGYGGSEATLTRIADLWTPYIAMKRLQTPFDEEFRVGPGEVAEMMVLLKIARSSGVDSPSTADDKLDIAGYAILNAELHDGAKKENNDF